MRDHRRIRLRPPRALRAACAVILAIGCNGTPQPSSAPTEERRSPPQPDKGYALDESLERGLEALGYLDTVPTDAPELRGVTQSSPDATRSVYLYSSRRSASASLVSRDGTELHRWGATTLPQPAAPWMHVEPLDDGSLLVMVKDRYHAKLDWDGNLLWKADVPAHHDVALAPDGNIIVLVRDRESLRINGRSVPVLVDSLQWISQDGAQLQRVPLLPLFREDIDRLRMPRVRRAVARAKVDGTSVASLARAGGVADLLHSNAVTVLRTDIPGLAPAGSILLSSRALSRIAILSPNADKRLWIFGEGVLDGQHDATHLGNGNILVFDNGLRRGAPSRVLEVNPKERSVVWSYEHPDFFSQLRGGAQALPNGDILITESDRGRVFAVDRSGTITWEFWNPDVRETTSGPKRGAIYRMNQFPRSRFPRLSAGAAER